MKIRVQGRCSQSASLISEDFYLNRILEFFMQGGLRLHKVPHPTEYASLSARVFTILGRHDC